MMKVDGRSQSEICVRSDDGSQEKNKQRTLEKSVPLLVCDLAGRATRKKLFGSVFLIQNFFCVDLEHLKRTISTRSKTTIKYMDSL